MKIIKSFLCLFFISQAAEALVVGPFFVEGKVKSFDAASVIIICPQSEITVPRDLIYQKNLKPNQKLRVDFLPEYQDKLKFVKR